MAETQIQRWECPDHGPTLVMDAPGPAKRYCSEHRAPVEPVLVTYVPVHTATEGLVPERLLDDVRVSMKMLNEQNSNAWREVDRLHARIRDMEKGGRELDGVIVRLAEENSELHAKLNRYRRDSA